MVHIKTIKLFNGEKRYAVVAPFTSTTKGENGMVTKTENLPVEYTVGTGKDKKVYPAIFPVTAEGLEKAKEIQKLFKK